MKHALRYARSSRRGGLPSSEPPLARHRRFADGRAERGRPPVRLGQDVPAAGGQTDSRDEAGRHVAGTIHGGRKGQAGRILMATVKGDIHDGRVGDRQEAQGRWRRLLLGRGHGLPTAWPKPAPSPPQEGAKRAADLCSDEATMGAGPDRREAPGHPAQPDHTESPPSACWARAATPAQP
ncbi:hypothetical protein D3C85_908540 [compost metagenome]